MRITGKDLKGHPVREELKWTKLKFESVLHEIGADNLVETQDLSALLSKIQESLRSITKKLEDIQHRMEKL